MKDQLRGCIKINVSGRELYRFINQLHGSHISCYGQYVRGEVFCAEIYRRDLKAVSRLAEAHGLVMKSFEYDTLSARVLRHRRRWGIVLGMLMLIAASVYFSGVVVTIDIQGNERIASDEILSALDELDIRPGVPFRKIDYVQSEDRLTLMVDGLAWAGMHRTGHRLVVEVTELVEIPEMKRKRIPCNLVAAHDGQIVSVTVQDGMLMHIVGDYVYAGDMIVSGVTTDDTGHTTLHHAMGQIIADYEDEAVFSGELNVSRSVPTGRTDKRRRLRLFSLDIPLYFGEDKYDSADSKVRKSPLVVFGRELPIALVTEELTETAVTELTLTEDELAEQLMTRVYLYEQNFLSGAEILERDISSALDGETLTYTVRYLLRGDIVRQQEILIK